MAKARRQTADPTKVIGYVRVSTEEQAGSGLGLEAQRTAIVAECERRGWTIVELIEDAGVSAKTLVRPGMARALELLSRSEAGVLVVAKLDRATRSVMDAANLLTRSQHEGWKLVALDLGLDPTTPAGELVATIMAAVAQWERRAIGARTREALATKRAQGIRLGRPSVLPAAVVARIVSAYEAGSGWSVIARQLDAEAVPTAHGGLKWHPATVRAVVLAHGRAAA
jgi:DNA invertase Pin-like site-specific DNA recombinase